MKYTGICAVRAILKMAAVAIAALPLAASGAAYMKLGDIKGEARSSDGSHDGWIVIESMSWPSGAAPTGDTISSDRESFSEVSVTKMMDASSPGLREACSSGQHYPEAEIHVEKESGNRRRTEYLKYKLTNVMVTCVGDGGSGQQQERITLHFADIEVLPEAGAATVRPTAVRPQRVTPRPVIRGPQSGNN